MEYSQFKEHNQREIKAFKKNVPNSPGKSQTLVENLKGAKIDESHLIFPWKMKEIINDLVLPKRHNSL